MKTRFTIITLLLLCLLLGSVASAQDTTLEQTFTFASGAVFNYPKDWTAGAEENGAMLLSNGEAQIFVADFAYFEALNLSASDDLLDALSAHFNARYADQNLEFQPDQATKDEIGGRLAVSYSYSDSSGAWHIMKVIHFSDGSFGLIELRSLGTTPSPAALITSIAESFDHVGSSGGLSQNIDLSAAAADCTVSTTQARSVQVRVGPGTNRSVVTFLPANTEFTVAGRATARDDSNWWKLNKEDVAPTSGANEMWVAEADVTETGNCDAVADVNAPPVIPISAAPPPSQATSEPGQSGGVSSSGAVPRNGLWQFTYGEIVASCQNTTTVHVPPPDSEVVSVSTTNNGQTMLLDSTPMTRNGDTYSGSYNITLQGAPLNAQIALQVQSTTLMTGRIDFNFNSGNRPCSAGSNFTATHL